jgi:hypothetical protein
MNEDKRYKCDLFVLSLRLLDVDDDGLTDDVDFNDVKAIAGVCSEVRQITAGYTSPYEILLHRVADLTERVCYTWAHPDPATVKEWLIARGELLELLIPRG